MAAGDRDRFERGETRGVLSRLAASLDRFETLPHEEVVALGAQRNPAIIGNAVLTHQQQDAGFTRQLVGNAGLG